MYVSVRDKYAAWVPDAKQYADDVRVAAYSALAAGARTHIGYKTIR